jgi:hypothetical protein
MPIDTTLVNNLFRASSVADECPACGKTSWRFGKDTISLPYAQAAAPQDSVPSIHAIPTICNNCSYMRLFLDRED